MNAERIAELREWVKREWVQGDEGDCYTYAEDSRATADLLLLLDEKAEQIEANVGVPDEQDLPAALEKMASPAPPAKKIPYVDEGQFYDTPEEEEAREKAEQIEAGATMGDSPEANVGAPEGSNPSPGLSDADKRALDTLVAYAREGAERIYEGKASARDVEAALLHIRSRLTAPPLLANGDAQPKPTVTRTQIKNIAWGILSYLNLSRKAELVSAITDSELVPGLRSLGITIEEEKNG